MVTHEIFHSLFHGAMVLINVNFKVTFVPTIYIRVYAHVAYSRGVCLAYIVASYITVLLHHDLGHPISQLQFIVISTKYFTIFHD